MSESDIRKLYQSGELTWEDLLEITGLHSSQLYEVLYDLIQAHESDCPAIDGFGCRCGEGTMKTVNAKGLAALKAWVEKTSGADDAGPLCLTDSRALNAWAAEAEESMLAGNPPIVEMSPFHTRSGRPETFTLSSEMIADSEGEQ